jgi:hypothetical protein
MDKRRLKRAEMKFMGHRRRNEDNLDEIKVDTVETKMIQSCQQDGRH